MDVRVVEIAETLRSRGQWLAVAESCTGGLVAKTLTDLAGSSAWFERGVVSYSNRSKEDLLGVAASVLQQHGAVSEPTVRAMAMGLLDRAPVDWTLALTGIAGPGGGSDGKPVGTVWIACARRGGDCSARCFRFDGDRASVRLQSVRMALDILVDRLRHAG
ncbi:CinA family protein [Sinimarinibacterium thermocellulolyticum]|uniref:CinA family protein n=1 Tax=Sinimarinibacterium thermocellulolyticum TaxID=3170016 RepID=A0ABV2A7V6_9GAMM